MSSKHGYAAALSLLVVCGLGGCTGGGDDPPVSSSTGATGGTGGIGATGSVGSGGGATTTSPSSSTSTASPATATVQIPAAARAHTEAGAEAFVRFFVEQSNIASMTADTSLLPALSDPRCKSCAGLQGEVADLKAKGRRYTDAPVTASRVAALDGAPKGQQFVRLQMSQNRVDVVNASGAKVATDPKGELARTMSLIWVEGRWFIFGIAQ